METLTIRTGRKGFVMPERILCLEPLHIATVKTMDEIDTQVHTGVETLAQTGALHVRYLSGFDRHAFLLKIERYSAKTPCPPGTYRISGHLVSQSRLAYAYDLSATFDDECWFKGHFLFAVRDYDQAFQKSTLEPHYRNLLACLTSDTPKN